MENEELESFLLKSNAFKSLSIEAEVFNIVRQYFPNAIRSPYFTDPETKKLREIDISAWARFKKAKANDTIFCNLRLFIECKTNKAYNIIVDGEFTHYASNLYNWEIWVGDDTNHRFERSREVLANTPLDIDDINKDVTILYNLFYPDDTERIWDIKPEIFSEIPSYSGFRETNIKDEKDLENSVLWRAFQSLSSAQTAYENKIWKSYLEDLMHYGEYKTNERLGMNDFTIKDMVDQHAKNVNFIQKIVVIDSPLWKRISNDKVESVKYFRLLRQRIDSIYIDVVDVVNRQYFHDYMKSIDRFYKKFIKKEKIDRVF